MLQTAAAYAITEVGPETMMEDDDCVPSDCIECYKRVELHRWAHPMDAVWRALHNAFGGLGLFARYQPAEWKDIRLLAYPDRDDLESGEEATLHPCARDKIRRIRSMDPSAMFSIQTLEYRGRPVSWVLYAGDAHSGYTAIYAWPEDWLPPEYRP